MELEKKTARIAANCLQETFSRNGSGLMGLMFSLEDGVAACHTLIEQLLPINSER